MQIRAVVVLVLAATTLTGCTGGASPQASPSASRSASSPSAGPSTPAPGQSSPPPQGLAAAPEDPAAPAPGAPQGPPAPRRLVDAGISVEVPEGWSASSMDPASRQAAVAAEQDQQAAAFLKSRLDGMSTTGGVMYLYDFSALDRGVLSAVEVYRYPGTDARAVADQKIAPAMQEAGLSPVVGTTDLPAGPAVTVTGRTDAGGVTLTNAVALLVLGPSVVSLNATFGDPGAARVQAVLGSVRAA